MPMARVSERTHKKINKLRKKVSRDTGIPEKELTSNRLIELALDAFTYVPPSQREA